MTQILQVIGAGATRRAMADAAASFGPANGCTVETRYTHGHDVRDALLDGRESGDVVSLPAAMIASLAAAGKIVAGSEVDLGAISVALAVRRGGTPPDIGSVAGLLAAIAASETIVMTTQGSGRHVAALFDRLGIAAQTADKIVTYDTGAKVNDHLASGSGAGEIGFGVATEFLSHPDGGVDVVGALPGGHDDPTRYQAALLAGSREDALARRFLDYLTSPEAVGYLARSGVAAGAAT